MRLPRLVLPSVLVLLAGCEPIARVPVCGNGQLESGEACDDGNGSDTDACTTACKPARCGDALVRTGTEECDDGNTLNTDGCSNNCLLSVCGDGQVRAGVEDCDAQGGADTSGCDGSTAGANACTSVSCGDGYANAAANEACDELGGADSATCDGSAAEGNKCTLVSCGDGYANAAANEACDEAGGADSATCDGLDAGAEQCTLVSCGDGYANLTAGETCDVTGGASTAECDGSDAGVQKCTGVSCGDGYANAAANEACDVSGGADSAECDGAGAGAQKCTAASCGDGYANQAAGEACDISGGADSAECDGTAAGGDQCTAAVCGDGYANSQAGELCDDAGDSASCDGGSSQPCTVATCGDGYTNTVAGEECDSGGSDSPTCDMGGGAANACTLSGCRDGYHNALAGEACDDGDSDDTNGCRNDCSLPRCGDGVVQVGVEFCDEGPTPTSPYCTAWCGKDHEPNNTFAEAQARASDPTPVVIRGPTRILGSVVGADVDVFKLEFAQPMTLRFETFTENFNDCRTTFNDFTELELFREVTTAWTGLTAYPLGAVVRPSTANGHYYVASVSGTSSAAEPIWPTANGSFSDGSVTWVYWGTNPGVYKGTTGSFPNETRSGKEGISNCSAIVFEVAAGTSYLQVSKLVGAFDVDFYQLEVEVLDRVDEVEAVGATTNNTGGKAELITGTNLAVYGVRDSGTTNDDYFALHLPTRGSLRIELVESSDGTGLDANQRVDFCEPAATAPFQNMDPRVYVYPVLAPSMPAAWQPGTAYPLDALVRSTGDNGKFYKATSGGVSGATEPSWPTVTVGQTVADGSVVWANQGNLLGSFLAEDDGTGRGDCSLLDGTGSTAYPDGPLHDRPPGYYVIRVTAGTGATGIGEQQFDYRLGITVRSP